MNKKYMDESEFNKAYTLGYNSGFTIGQEMLKAKVLEILKTSIPNLDLSWEECDERFIEKIEKL